jgi:hypothetical protein
VLADPVVIYDSAQGSGSLQFVLATSSNGTAVVTVTVNDGQNVNSLISRSFNVTARRLTSPVITQQPGPVSVALGGSATFQVTATGAGPLSYQWRRDGVLLGSTGATLVISPVTAGDVGSYEVVVSNAGGSVTSTAASLQLSTSFPPIHRIEYQPGADRVEVFFPTQNGSTYFLESSPEPVGAAWTQLTSVPGNGGELSLVDSMNGQGRRFYRLRVE